MVMVHTRGNVVVSVPLPVIKLLKLGTCKHLVSLLPNVVLDDLENVISVVNGKPRHGVLSCLGGLHDLEFHVNLHIHVVLGVGEGGGGGKLLVMVGEGGGGAELLVVVGEGGVGSELLVVGGEGGSGGEDR
jgi:hypothetical protein